MWSTSSISHHSRGGVGKVAQAMSQGSAIYLEAYVLCGSACAAFLLTSERTIVRWFMNMYVPSLEGRHREHRRGCERRPDGHVTHYWLLLGMFPASNWPFEGLTLGCLNVYLVLQLCWVMNRSRINHWRNFKPFKTRRFGQRLCLCCHRDQVKDIIKMYNLTGINIFRF